MTDKNLLEAEARSLIPPPEAEPETCRRCSHYHLDEWICTEDDCECEGFLEPKRYCYGEDD